MAEDNKQVWKRSLAGAGLLLAVTASALSLYTLLGSGSSKESLAGTNEYKEQALLWYRRSAEMTACYHQAYQLAEFRLQKKLDSRMPGSSTPVAVVLDLDETVLDNSPWEASLLGSAHHFPYGWADWTAKAEARALPGAVAFLRFADSLGVSIFYVSNRKVHETGPTLQNMLALGLPQADSTHLLLRDKDRSKKSRWQQIERTHNILLLVGDNLNDFSELFENQTNDRRRQLADSLRQVFGRRWIVLPNPLYGEWENAAMKYQNDLDYATRRKLRMEEAAK